MTFQITLVSINTSIPSLSWYQRSLLLTRLLLKHSTERQVGTQDTKLHARIVIVELN